MVCGQSEVINGFALEIPINDGGGQFDGAVDCLHLGLIALGESENFACFWRGDFVPSNVEPDLPLMFIRQVNRMRAKPAPADPTTKECGYCASSIPIKAIRCPHCTSELKAV